MKQKQICRLWPSGTADAHLGDQEERGQSRETLNSQKREDPKMKMLKMLFVLFCLLAYAWVFSLPAQAQVFQPMYASYQASGDALNAFPFNAVVEKTSPLFADRQMTLKIAEIPPGDQITVHEKYNVNRDKGLFIMLVTYTDRSGKERAGWLSGTLHAHYPNQQTVPLASR
jgi:hypothetical protein